jgi:hypothetical protein
VRRYIPVGAGARFRRFFAMSCFHLKLTGRPDFSLLFFSFFLPLQALIFDKALP